MFAHPTVVDSESRAALDAEKLVVQARRMLEKETRKQKVLVVDDNDGCRTEIAGLLNNNGYWAIGTTSDEVLGRFLEVRPDIVFTEIVMTGQEGLDLIRKLRQLREDLTIIAVTGGARAGSYLRMAQLLGARRLSKSRFRQTSY